MSSQTLVESSNDGPGVTDLAAVVALVVGTIVVVVFEAPAVVRLPLALLTALFLPGYALTAALFPAGPTGTGQGSFRGLDRGVTLLERLVLSVGLSLVLVVSFGLLAGLVGELTTAALLAGIAILTMIAVVSAWYRRQQVLPDDRYAPRVRLSSVSRPDVLTVVLALSVLFAGGALALTQTVDDQSDSVTELYLLTESDDGELQAAAYPTTFSPGETRSLSVAVENGEREETTYTVVAQLQRAEKSDDGAVVRDRREIATRQVTVPADERQVLDETVTPEESGTYRLVYLLYRGDEPADPRISNSYREVHLWLTVTEPDEESV